MRVKVLILLLLGTMFCGCERINEPIPLEDDIDTESFQDKSLSTEQNGDELYEVSKESDNNSEIIAKDYADLLEADGYYSDYYVQFKYLIFGTGRICSLYVTGDSEIVIEIPYENVASIDYNVIDGFIYVNISDKQNGKMTFIFRKEELPDIEKEINFRYVDNGR